MYTIPFLPEVTDCLIMQILVLKNCCIACAAHPKNKGHEKCIHPEYKA